MFLGPIWGCLLLLFCSKPHPAGWHCRDRVGEDLGLFVASHCAHQCPGLNKNLPRANTYKTILGGCWISTTGAPGFRFIAKRRWSCRKGPEKIADFSDRNSGFHLGIQAQLVIFGDGQTAELGTGHDTTNICKRQFFCFGNHEIPPWTDHKCFAKYWYSVLSEFPSIVALSKPKWNMLVQWPQFLVIG